MLAVLAASAYVPPHAAAVGRTAVRMQLSPPPLPDLDTLKRLASPETQKELFSLSNELSKLALQQDPQVVVRRSIDLALAVQTVTAENIRNNGLAPPTVEAVPLLLRRLFEELGATYVKLGQFIASSPTLFPAEYVAEFQKCLDATPPMPWEVVKQVVEEELGRPIGSMYKHVERTPLASASIAQVHAATLVSGEEVVIKVQKVGVQASLRADLDLIFATSRVLEILLPTQEGFEQKGELSEIVGEIRRAILEEVDFKLEAQRTAQFADFLLGRPELQGAVTVPRVYPSASAARVLTLERLYGTSLTDLEAVRAYSSTPELALITALNTWVSSVLYNQWFHADVHAGNLLILKDGRVAFIDFGIVGAIPPATASAMLDFVRCYATQDLNGIAAALAQMGFTKEGLDSAQAMPIEELQEGVLDETQLNRLVASIAKVADGYGIRFPREFALLVKQVLYFDRYTRLLAPDLDILADERLMSNMPADAAGGGALGGAPPAEAEATGPPLTVEVVAS